MPVDGPGEEYDPKWEFQAPKWFDFSREETSEEVALQEAFFSPTPSNSPVLAAELQADDDPSPHPSAPGIAHDHAESSQLTSSNRNPPHRIASSHSKQLEQARSAGKRKRQLADTAFTSAAERTPIASTPRAGATTTRRAAAAAAAASGATPSEKHATGAPRAAAVTTVSTACKRRKITASEDEGKQYPQDAVARLPHASTSQPTNIDSDVTFNSLHRSSHECHGNAHRLARTPVSGERKQQVSRPATRSTGASSRQKQTKRKASEGPPALSTDSRAKRMQRSHGAGASNSAAQRTHDTSNGPPSLNTRQRSRASTDAGTSQSQKRSRKLETVAEAPERNVQPPQLKTSTRSRKSNANATRQDDTMEARSNSGVLTRSQRARTRQKNDHQQVKLLSLEEKPAAHCSRKKRLSSQQEPLALKTETRSSKRQRTINDAPKDGPTTRGRSGKENIAPQDTSNEQQQKVSKLNEHTGANDDVENASFKARRVPRSHRQPFAPLPRNTEGNNTAIAEVQPFTLNTSHRAKARDSHDNQQRRERQMAELDARWQTSKSRRMSREKQLSRRSMRASMLRQSMHADDPARDEEILCRKRASNAV